MLKQSKRKADEFFVTRHDNLLSKYFAPDEGRKKTAAAPAAQKGES